MSRTRKQDREFVAKLKTLHFPEKDSPWTSGRRYVHQLVRPQYAHIGGVDPEAFVSSPAEAKEVLKRQGRLRKDTEIEARN